jgi:hypothetical protein
VVDCDVVHSVCPLIEAVHALLLGVGVVLAVVVCVVLVEFVALEVDLVVVTFVEDELTELDVVVDVLDDDVDAFEVVVLEPAVVVGVEPEGGLARSPTIVMLRY